VNEPKSLTELFGQSIAAFPKYIVEWTVSLLIVVLTETIVTTIAVLAVLSGLALHSVLLGLVVFFAAYVFTRAAFVIGDAIAGSSRYMVNTAASLYMTRQQPPDPMQMGNVMLEAPTQALIPEA